MVTCTVKTPETILTGGIYRPPSLYSWCICKICDILDYASVLNAFNGGYECSPVFFLQFRESQNIVHVLLVVSNPNGRDSKIVYKNGF